MASGSSRQGKTTPFKRGSAKPPAAETVPYGQPRVQLDNIKKAAAASAGAKPKPAKIWTNDPKNPRKQQMDNLRQLASGNVMDGDNPYKG